MEAASLHLTPRLRGKGKLSEMVEDAEYEQDNRFFINIDNILG